MECSILGHVQVDWKREKGGGGKVLKKEILKAFLCLFDASDVLAINNGNIKSAVDLYLKQPGRAEAIMGLFKLWDVRSVTSMKNRNFP
jgi:hypothetical protein